MTTISHSRPSLNEREALAILEVIRGGEIVQGSKVRQFEEAMAEYVGVNGAVAVSSGTAALHLALLALGIGKDDQVLMPSYVCTAVLNAVNFTGATPVLADIDSETFNISATSIADKLSTKTKAIIVPHLFGQPADLEALINFGVPVIEDCAQALGAEYQNRPVGSLGTLAVFSFYATKVISTGEGGMVLGHSQEFLDRIRDLRDYDNRLEYELRFNYKMTDLQAAMGLVQLSKLPEFLAKRHEIAHRYQQAFEDLPVTCPHEHPDRTHIYYRYVLKVRSKLEEILTECERRRINFRRPVFKPLHHYLNLKGFPDTNQVYQRALSVPIYPDLGAEEIDMIIENVREVVKGIENSE